MVSFGYAAALIALALGWDAIVVFTLIYAAFSASDVIGNRVKFLSYGMAT